MKLLLFVVIVYSVCVIEGYIHRRIVIPKHKLFPKKTDKEWHLLEKDIEYIPKKIESSEDNLQPESAGKVETIAATRIIGGKAARLKQFPWQVSVVMDSDFFCGGSLITQNWILTAGHCLHNIKEFTVRVGSLKPFEGQTLTTNLRKLYHNYNPHSIKNDIGLIQVKEGFNLTENVNAIKLPPSWIGDYLGELAILSGWGKTADNSSLASTLQYANLKITDGKSCLKTFGTFNSRQICASGAEFYKSACGGDSGSALVVQDESNRYVQIGIVSFGSSFGCEKGFPLVFTRVSSYLQWISRHIRLI